MSLKLEHVNYVYSPGTAYEIHALKDICLEIKSGEFVGLIGHTGSGKSTLVQHLNGLVKASEGHIYFHGEDIYTTKESERLLRLPMFHQLEPDQVEYIVQQIKDFYMK